MTSSVLDFRQSPGASKKQYQSILASPEKKIKHQSKLPLTTKDRERKNRVVVSVRSKKGLNMDGVDHEVNNKQSLGSFKDPLGDGVIGHRPTGSVNFRRKHEITKEIEDYRRQKSKASSIDFQSYQDEEYPLKSKNQHSLSGSALKS